MRAFVTGGAGFIGSNLVDRLLTDGHTVTVYDNLVTGQTHFLDQARQHLSFTFIEGDLLDAERLTETVNGHDIVFHLAANADVRFGTQHPRKDLEQNTIATFNVLEAVRINKVPRIVFSSTGSIYGEPEIFPTPETSSFPIQTSLYGASKLAGEGLIAAYSNGFGIQAYIFRFVSILGERYTHGHVFDFYKQILHNPHQIKVLGNGKQRKSYLYVQDCIDAIFTVLDHAHETINIYNLGTNEYCEVNNSLNWICEHLGVNPERQYSGGNRGWVGDSPFIFLDTQKVCALGWRPKLSIQQGVIKTVEYLQSNPQLLEHS